MCHFVTVWHVRSAFTSVRRAYVLYCNEVTHENFAKLPKLCEITPMSGAYFKVPISIPL